MPARFQAGAAPSGITGPGMAQNREGVLRACMNKKAASRKRAAFLTVAATGLLRDQRTQWHTRWW